jgi:hypothetical protein
MWAGAVAADSIEFCFLEVAGDVLEGGRLHTAKFERALCRVCGVEIDARQFHRLFMRLTSVHAAARRRTDRSANRARRGPGAISASGLS